MKVADRLLKTRAILAPVAGSVLLLVWSLTGDRWLQAHKTWIFFALYTVAFSLLFRPRYALPFVGMVALLWHGLGLINEEKIALTQFPVTSTDLRIFAGNPEGLLNAIKAPWWIRSTVVVVPLALVCLVAYLVLRRCLLLFREGGGRRLLGAVGSSTGFAFVFFLGFGLFLFLFFHDVQSYVEAEDLGWDPLDVSDLSRELTVPGFLAYTYYIEGKDTGDLFEESIAESPPGKQETRDAVTSKVALQRRRSAELPNIVLMIAESTFDPNLVFKLERRVESGLFHPREDTESYGLLYVNAVGGGTWITEFESITGLDSRLFGYAGYYTHVSLAPYVKETLPRYLKERGYMTSAYYSAEGEFYNVKNAFASYGFDEFFDSRALELPDGWSATDEAMVDAVIAASRPAEKPFFKLVSLLENHSPHPCLNFHADSEFVTRFTSTTDFATNCSLNEYARITESTSRAFDKMISFLQQSQKETGRPYVVLIVGDHQPHTFTQTGGASDFSAYRAIDDVRYTFHHLVSSMKGVVDCCAVGSPHVTLMPSLLSAYVAADPDDIYLAVNFLSYQVCGNDILRGRLSGGLEGTGSESSAPACAIYRNLVAAYRETIEN